MPKKDSQWARRRAYKKIGKCLRCGNLHGNIGHWLCPSCKAIRYAYTKRWLHKNRHKIREYNQKYKAGRDRWYRKNRKRIAQVRRTRYLAQRTEILTLLGGKCARCEITDPRLLQIDHINNDGARDRLKFSQWNAGNSRYFRQLRKEIMQGSKKYQLLCANHNWLKRYE